MAKFKKKKFRAEKPNSEDENNDLPEIEATEDEKKEIAKWTTGSTEATDSASTNVKCEKCGQVAQHAFDGAWFCQKCGFEHKEPTDESVEETSTESKPEPTEDPIDKSATKKLTDRLFWLRIAVAIAGGVIATFAFEDIADVEEKRWTSIGFMIALFVATVIIAKSWRIKIANRKKYVTTGIGSFVFMYLFIWIFSYTLVNTGTSQSMIPGI
jgi:ribosomal protein L37AE/L43A